MYHHLTTKINFLNKKNFYQFSENTLSLFAIKGIELGLTIFLIPYLILKVGIENFGIYSYAMALMLIFMNLMNYGFNLVTVRELTKSKQNAQKVNQLFNEVLSVKLFLFGISATILVVLIAIIPEFWEQKTLYFYSLFLLIGEFFSLRWFFLGIEKMKFKTFINLISTAIFVALVVLFVRTESDYQYIPMYQGIGLFVIALGSFLWVVKKYKINIQLISFKEVITYLIANFSSFINLVIPSTFGTLSVFLVGIFGLPIHVSFMQIGVKILGAFSTVNAILTKVFYSIINRNSTMLYLSRMVLISIGFVLSMAMFFTSDFIIAKWLSMEPKEELGNTVSIIKILSFVPFLVAVISSYGINGLLTMYKDVLYSKITLIAFMALILCSIVLIPFYPIYGGAIALLLGRLVYAGLAVVLFKKENVHV